MRCAGDDRHESRHDGLNIRRVLRQSLRTIGEAWSSRLPVTEKNAGSNPAWSANLSRFGVMEAPLPEEQVA